MVTPTLLQAAEEIGSGSCRVRLLGPDDAGEIPSKYRSVIQQLYSKHRLVTEEGLRHMTPLLCAAVRRVVFVDDPRYAAEDGWVLDTEPDLVFINYDPLRRGFGAYPVVKSIQSFLHESTHAADQMLQAHRAEPGLLEGFLEEELFPKGEAEAESWPASSARVAEKVIENNRLKAGFRAEWVRTHRTFQKLGLAGAYRGAEAAQGESGSSAIAKEGFMSLYGSSVAGEDIAEFASWIMVAPLFGLEWSGESVPEDEKPKDFACQLMQEHGEATVPAALSAVFTKANLLLSAGFIDEEDYERCVGKLAIEGPGEGVFVYDIEDGNTQLKRNFNTDVSARIGSHPKLEQHVFLLEASGTASVGPKEFPATVKLRLPIGPADREIEVVSWPRGVWDLRQLGADFRLEVPDHAAATFVVLQTTPDGSTPGMVL
ncbi:MAG: hypothetical protein R3244_11730, partial [Thermoanaerobaculia bacterium]|nr:hypothetical protein [Thermoanaerobaculia bacterium]